MFSERFRTFSREKLESRRELLPQSVLEELEGLQGELHAAVAFLYATLPLPDTRIVAFEDMCREAEVALNSRWPETPEDIFVSYVLCPRVNNETLEPSRPFFHGALQERVGGLSMEKAVLAVNRWCCEHVTYQSSDDRTEGPLTAYRSGKGRCGEESTFAVYVLRSVGIPARQVYAPWWSHCDDNHAWVEVYIEGTWHFLGACEPEPVLNKGWFLGASARAMVIHGRAFSAYTGNAMEREELIEERNGAYLYNATCRYAPTTRLSVRVHLPDGTPAAGAKIACQVLNMGDWRTIANLTADHEGNAQLTCGKGSLHLACAHGGLLGEGDVHTGEASSITLTLGQSLAPEGVGEFHPPETKLVTPPVVEKQAEEENRSFLLSAALHRAARQRQWYKEAVGGTELPTAWTKYIKAACGNGEEIARFLREGSRSWGDWALRLLDTLPEKDLRDTPADTLLAHMERAMPHLPQYKGREELFARYVLCPRIGTEKLYPWGKIALGEREATVAGLRTSGVAARLNPFTGEPEGWGENGFAPVHPQLQGFLTVQGEGQYGQSWSLAHREKTGFVPLHTGLTGEEMELPIGMYRLMSTVRLPSGKQRFYRKYFTLEPGQRLTVEQVRPEVSTTDMLVDVPVPPVTLYREGQPHSLTNREQPQLLLFLQPGMEPTAHILNELMEEGEELLQQVECFPALPPQHREEETVEKFLTRYPHLQVYEDGDNEQEPMARALFLEPGDYPLLFLLYRGRCRFARSGYAVGTVELLKRLTEILSHEL